MKIDTYELRQGGHNGKIVWICDYRWSDFDKKEDRNIKPTKVLIRSTDETTKRVNYSNCFFSEIKKDKVVNSSMIKLFDNTGYRSYAGVAVHLFTEEDECKKYYKKQVAEVFDNFKEYSDNKLLRLDIIKKQITSLV